MAHKVFENKAEWSCGKKLDTSNYARIVTKMMAEGMADAHIKRYLADNCTYTISLPSLKAFRVNYYPERLKKLKGDSERIVQQNSGQIKTYIDESMAQVTSMKADIESVTKQLNHVNTQIQFIRKFETIFQNAIDKYVDSYDPDKPESFIPALNPASEEQQRISDIVQQMGELGKDALTTYIQTHNPYSLIKLSTYLTAKLRDLRSSVVSIHKDIFKSYRSLSISQEMTTIFERYNGIIIEEFFADKQTIDPIKFARVQQKVKVLFDELNVRYQGLDASITSPSVTRSPNREDPAQEAENMAKGILPHVPPPRLKGKSGRPPAQTTIIARERAKANTIPATIVDEPTIDDKDTDLNLEAQEEPTQEEVTTTLTNMPHDTQDLFGSITGED